MRTGRWTAHPPPRPPQQHPTNRWKNHPHNLRRMMGAPVTRRRPPRQPMTLQPPATPTKRRPPAQRPPPRWLPPPRWRLGRRMPRSPLLREGPPRTRRLSPPRPPRQPPQLRRQLPPRRPLQPGLRSPLRRRPPRPPQPLRQLQQQRLRPPLRRLPPQRPPQRPTIVQPPPISPWSWVTAARLRSRPSLGPCSWCSGPSGDRHVSGSYPLSMV